MPMDGPGERRTSTSPRRSPPRAIAEERANPHGPTRVWTVTYTVASGLLVAENNRCPAHGAVFPSRERSRATNL